MHILTIQSLFDKERAKTERWCHLLTNPGAIGQIMTQRLGRRDCPLAISLGHKDIESQQKPLYSSAAHLDAIFRWKCSFINSVWLDQLQKVGEWHHDSSVDTRSLKSRCICRQFTQNASKIQLKLKEQFQWTFLMKVILKWNQLAPFEQPFTTYLFSINIWHWLDRKLTWAPWMYPDSVIDCDEVFVYQHSQERWYPLLCNSLFITMIRWVRGKIITAIFTPTPALIKTGPVAIIQMCHENLAEVNTPV